MSFVSMYIAKLELLQVQSALATAKEQRIPGSLSTEHIWDSLILRPSYLASAF